MQIEISELIRIFNEALKIDPEAVNKIFKNKVPCKQELISHPTIVVGGSDEAPTLSCLGLITGAIGSGDRIGAAWHDDDDPSASFIEEFVIVPEDHCKASA